MFLGELGVSALFLALKGSGVLNPIARDHPVALVTHCTREWDRESFGSHLRIARDRPTNRDYRKVLARWKGLGATTTRATLL